MSESSDVSITVATSILIITSIVGNALVCALIKRNPKMRKPLDYLLVNLAVAEIIYSTFYTPKIIWRHTVNHPEGMTGSILCTLLTDGNISRIGAASSIFCMIVIAIERYYAVVYPDGIKENCITRNLTVIIMAFWIFAVIISTPAFLNEQFDNIDKKSCTKVWADHEKLIPKVYSFIWSALVFISFTLMVGLYSRVVYTLWFKHIDDCRLRYRQKGDLKVRKQVTLMVLTVSAIFGICWGTDRVLHVIEQATSYKFAPVVFLITDTMIMFNSAVNPFAYVLINQRFRRKMVKTICCRPVSVYVPRKPRRIELANRSNKLPTNASGPSTTHGVSLKTNFHTDFVSRSIEV